MLFTKSVIKVQVSSRKFQNFDKIPTIFYFVVIASLDCMDTHVYSHEISKRNSYYLSSLTHFGVGGGSGSDGCGGGFGGSGGGGGDGRGVGSGGGGGRFNLN